MGVQDTYDVLKALKVVGTPMDCRGLQGLDVGVMGLYYSYIRTNQQRLVYDDLRSNTSTRCRGWYKSSIQNWPSPSHKTHPTTLHFDGILTLQKSMAQEKRTSDHTKKVERFRQNAGQLRELLTNNDRFKQKKKRRRGRLQEQLTLRRSLRSPVV